MVVVECLEDEDGAGFKLLDVQATSLAATASTGVQSTSDTSGTAWIDASRVVLFGGYRGGGLSSATASNTSGGSRPAGAGSTLVHGHAEHQPVREQGQQPRGGRLHDLRGPVRL